MSRVTDGGAPVLSAVRATRGATVVVALELPRGDRLLLQRAVPEAGVVSYQAWIGGPSGVTRDPVKIQRGPFTGDPWGRLQRAATDELGRR